MFWQKQTEAVNRALPQEAVLHVSLLADHMMAWDLSQCPLIEMLGEVKCCYRGLFGFGRGLRVPGCHVEQAVFPSYSSRAVFQPTDFAA